MGCGVSKIDTSGATTLPAKLRPIFLRRLEEIKKRRHAQPLKDSTPSKKELLLHDRDEEDNTCHFSSSEYDALKNVPLPTKDGTDPSTNESLNTRNSVNLFEKFASSKGKDPTKPTGKASKENEAATRDDKCNTKDEMPIESSLKMKATNEPKERETKGAKTKIEGKIENILTDKDGSEDEDGEQNKERMISHQDDDAFPGSPSFRIYFTDGMDDDQIENTRKPIQRPS